MLDDELIDNIPEQDTRILKGMFTNQSAAYDCLVQLKPEMFSDSTQEVAKFALQYIKDYRTPPTLRIAKEYIDTEIINDLEERFQKIEFNINELPYDIQKLKQHYIDIQTEDLKNEIQLNRIDLSILEKKIKSIKEISTPRVKVFNQGDVDQYVDDFRRQYIDKVNNPQLGRGILTGYSYLDYICNGIRPAELWIVGAETGAGKSQMLNNLACQMWMQKNNIGTLKDYQQGYNVLYFSLEMPFEPCFRRTMAKLADVPIYGLRDATLSKDQAELVRQASDFAKRYPYKFRIIDVPRGVSVPMIEEIYLDVCRTFKPDVIFVDYLGLLQDNEAEGDDWLKLGHISAKLHEFARVYNVPVLTAVQLNRLGQGKKDPADVVGVHRIGRSGMIAHNANVCIQIETRENEQIRGDMMIHIVKNRDGERGHHALGKNFANANIFDTPFAPAEAKVMEMATGFQPHNLSQQLQEALGIDLVKKAK